MTKFIVPFGLVSSGRSLARSSPVDVWATLYDVRHSGVYGMFVRSAAALVVFIGIASNAGAAQTLPVKPAPSAAAAGSPTPPATESDRTLTADRALAPTVITVTASRSADQMQYEAQSQNVVSVQMLERRQPETPTALLREEPGIFANLVGNQGSPIIRGEMGNRVVYLWDGIRLNNAALFSGPNGYFNEFPLGDLERIEVVRGPGAVEYGSDAVGGVINILSRRSDDFDTPHRFGGTLSSHYTSVASENNSFADLWGSFARINFIAGGSGELVGSYAAPHIGVIRNTGFSGEAGYTDFGIKVREHQVLHLGWIESVRQDVVSYSQSKLNASGIPRSNTPYEERGIGQAAYTITDAGKLSNELRLYTYFQHFRSPRNTDVESATTFSLTHTVSSQAVFGGGAQNSFALGRRGSLTIGVDDRSEDIWSNKLLFTTTKATGAVSTSIPNGSVPPGSYTVFDAFAINRWQVRKLTVTFAGRIDTIHLKSSPRPQDALTPFTVQDLTLDERWNPLTGSAGAVYQLTRNLSLTGDISNTFRAPSFSDALSTGVPVYASSLATVPSPGVQPEKGINYEGGARWNSPRFNATVTTFWTELADVIVGQTTGTINIPGVGVVNAQSNTNSGSGFVRGVEAAGVIHLNSQWALIGNVTHTRGQDTFQNVPLRFIPPTNGLAEISWRSKDQRFWSEASILLVDRLRRHAPNDESDAGFSQDPGYGSPSATNPAYRPGFQIPGYAVASLRFGARLLRQEQRGLDLTLDINNLLDQPYREPYSQQELLAPGVGAVIGGRWRF